MTKLTRPFTHPDVPHSEELSDRESLRVQPNQGGAVSLRSGSVYSGEMVRRAPGLAALRVLTMTDFVRGGIQDNHQNDG